MLKNLTPLKYPDRTSQVWSLWYPWWCTCICQHWYISLVHPNRQLVHEQLEMPMRKAWFLVTHRACLNLRTSVNNAGSMYQMAAKTNMIMARPAVPQTKPISTSSSQAASLRNDLLAILFRHLREIRIRKLGSFSAASSSASASEAVSSRHPTMVLSQLSTIYWAIEAASWGCSGGRGRFPKPAATF